MTALDAANAAPPASDKERKSALGWLAAVVVLGVIALIVAGVYSYKSHKAEVATIVNKPVALPELVKPTITRKKVATKTIANNTSNTPATAEYVPEVKAAKPVEIAKAKQPSQEHKSDEAPIDLPLRPIPPIPPQRSIP